MFCNLILKLKKALPTAGGQPNYLILMYVYVFFGHVACRIFSSPDQGSSPCPPALEVCRTFNRWTAREVPQLLNITNKLFQEPGSRLSPESLQWRLNQEVKL